MDERSRTFMIEAHFVKPPEKLYPNLTVKRISSFGQKIMRLRFQNLFDR
jgi:hypothetical protein